MKRAEAAAAEETAPRRIESTGLDPLPAIPRLARLRRDVLAAEYRLCTQKAALLTEAMMAHPRRNGPVRRAVSRLHFALFKRGLERTRRRIPQKRWQVALNNRLNRRALEAEGLSPSKAAIRYAEALRHILETMTLTVYPHERIVGNPSSQRIGAPIHPDLGGVMMLPELGTLGTRTNNPIGITDDQRRELEETIFPYWFDRSVMARVPLYSSNPDLSNRMLDGRFFVLTQFAGISHLTPDYPAVLEHGFEGIIERISERIEAKGGTTSKETLDFYEAAAIAARAAAGYGRRWSAALCELAVREEDGPRRRELLEMAAVCQRVPARPARTFHEALQSIFTTHTMLHQESFQHGISYGRMDQYLYPYYRRDLEAGRLTPVEAAELFGCFLVKAGELLPLFFDMATEYFSGLSSASGITLGGRRADGTDGVNELSHLMLRAYDQVRLRQPNFHVRVSEDTPPAFLDLCCEVLKKGGGIPAFFNDAAVVPALIRSGVAEADALDYSIVGCVEWGVPGKSFPAAGAVFVNLPMALHLALHDGRIDDRPFGPRTGATERFASMEDLLEALRIQIRHLLSVAVEGNNAIETAHARHRPTPLLSTVVEGCIESGVEVNAGGAVYNSTGCQGVGFADLVDSLAAIEKVVFVDERLSLDRFVRIVDDDFADQTELRAFILSKAPKYSVNAEPADRLAGVVSSLYEELVLGFETPRGGPYLPGFWSMTTHQGFGAKMPALPSGRLRGEPLANGISPCNGRDRLGPTAALASASRLDSSRVGNGCAFNQKLDSANLEGEKGNRIIEGLLRGYFAQGGMQVQYNMVEARTLVDARAHPEKHPDLVVRVSGYSAYFNDLTDAMKDELIARTLHFDSGPTCCE